jgi:hypothetical protein
MQTIKYKSNTSNKLETINPKTLVFLSMPQSVNLANIKQITISWSDANKPYIIPSQILIVNIKNIIMGNHIFIDLHQIIAISSNIYVYFPPTISIYLESTDTFSYRIYYDCAILDEIINGSHSYLCGHSDLRTCSSQNAEQIFISQCSSYRSHSLNDKLPPILCTAIYIETTSQLTLFELYICNTLHTKYNSHSIEFYDRLVYSSWTGDHIHALYQSLSQILPNELITIIEKYVAESSNYVYCFPIGLGITPNSCINFSRADSSVKIETKHPSLYNKIIYRGLSNCS